jgi:hypothetical protein
MGFTRFMGKLSQAGLDGRIFEEASNQLKEATNKKPNKRGET